MAALCAVRSWMHWTQLIRFILVKIADISNLPRAFRCTESKMDFILVSLTSSATYLYGFKNFKRLLGTTASFKFKNVQKPHRAQPRIKTFSTHGHYRCLMLLVQEHFSRLQYKDHCRTTVCEAFSEYTFAKNVTQIERKWNVCKRSMAVIFFSLCQASQNHVS